MSLSKHEGRTPPPACQLATPPCGPRPSTGSGREEAGVAASADTGDLGSRHLAGPAYEDQLRMAAEKVDSLVLGTHVAILKPLALHEGQVLEVADFGRRGQAQGERESIHGDPPLIRNQQRMR